MFLAAPMAVAACPQQLQNSIVTDPLQPGLPRHVPRFENARLSVAAPAATVYLAEPVEVSLTLHGSGAQCVQTVQCRLQAGQEMCGGRLSSTVQIVPVLSRPDGSHSITFTPLMVGRTGLVVTAEFADGVVAEQTTSFSVEYSTRMPEKLTVTLTGSSGRVSDIVALNLEEAEQGITRRLLPSALYSTYPEPLEIEPAKVTFTVRTAGGGEVVRLDPGTGTITPVALGHALVTAHFAGATAFTCVVVVRTSLDTPKKTNCDDLLQPGER